MQPAIVTVLSSGVVLDKLRATSHCPRSRNKNKVDIANDKRQARFVPGSPKDNNATMANSIFAVLLLGFKFVAGDLLGIPTVPFTESGDYFELSSLSGITVDTKHCEDTDTNGHTLIPPTLLKFANTFASDLETTGCHTEVNTGLEAGQGVIFVTIGNNSEFVDAAGRWTSEAYSLNVSTEGITIIGASPLGAWWATRSILQQAALNNGSIPTGYGVDAPGWGTRGIMVRLIPKITAQRCHVEY
jgi:hypothetical protein